jgi:hypothetical protein
MLGVNPGTANLPTFGDAKGLYVWVAGRARYEGEFRHLIESEVSRRGLSVSEITDVMLADIAVKGRPDAEIDWKALIASAKESPSLALDSTYFFYEKGGQGD